MFLWTKVSILRPLLNAAKGQASWNGACTFVLRKNLHIQANEEMKGALFWQIPANEEIKGALFWRTKFLKSETLTSFIVVVRFSVEGADYLILMHGYTISIHVCVETSIKRPPVHRGQIFWSRRWPLYAGFTVLYSIYYHAQV